ncbi:MAG: hypothetical protein H7A26_05470 [Spirochaetales bacterium]|nr:hypothetical protein [Spirochaetales bacterium]
MCNKIALFFIPLILTVMTAEAYDPSYSFGTYGQIEKYSDTGGAEYPAGISADAFQRNTLPSGYYSWYAAALFEYYLNDPDKYEDRENLAADLHLEGDLFAYEAGSTLSFSFNSIDYSSYIQPDWSASVIMNPSDFPYSVRLNYSGSWIYQESYFEDRIINRLQLSGAYDPSLRFGVEISLKAALEDYSEYYVLDDNGEDTSEERRDYILSAGLSFEGLAGYFLNWKLSSGMKFQDSNANRWISVNELEKDSEDLKSLLLQSEINWSPIISFKFGAEYFLEYVLYTYRKASASGGFITDDNLAVVNTGGSIDLGWTFNSSLFYNTSFLLNRSYSSDPEFDEWNFSIKGWLQYSF